MSPTSKSARLEQLELLLRAHPNGLRKSEIAKRLGVHRSTAGRYIMELSEKILLWEDDFQIGINERRSESHVSFTLPENFSIQMAIQTFNKQLDHRHTHLVTATRKLALAMKHQYPVTSEKMFKMAEEMDNIPDKGEKDMASYFEQLAEAIENKSFLDFTYRAGHHKARILPEEFTIEHSNPLSKALRISGKCPVTGKKCSFFLHNIKISREKHPDDELSECPFTKEGSNDSIHLKLRIFNPYVMDSFSSITNHSFQIEELTDGTNNVHLLVSFRKDLKNKLIQMGSDIEVLYPEDIRNSIKNEIEIMAGKYQRQSGEKSVYKEYMKDQEDSFTSIRIREIHHRIKNQLVSITSLINLYSSKSSNKSHISILDELNSKITAISMVHDMLTTGNSWPILPVNNFIKEMCLNLISSMETVREIEFHEEIVEIYLPENQITIIGLIIAELCINSLKHAFTNKSKGKISVILTKKNEVKTLRFKDDGKGLGNNPEDTLAAGTGHNLVNIFVEELGGSIKYLSEQGTEIVITFI